MSQIRFSLAFFVGILLQTLLVGAFILLLIVASYAQWKKVSKGRKVNPVVAFTTVFFGLSITTHWILGVHRVISSTLYLPSGMTVDQYLLPPYSVEEITRMGIFQLQIVIADLIMAYRMYHIYEKCLLACVIPAITITGLFAIGCGLTNQLRNFSTPADIKANNDWSTACFCVTLFNSVFMSVCISLRLWKVHRETARSDVNTKNSVIPRAIRVLVESAGVWTLVVAIDFLAFLAGSNLQYTLLDVTSPVVGISFCLIIVRLGSMTPELREDTWQSSRRSRMLSASDSRLSRLPVSLDRVKVERDVYVSESEGGMMEFRVIGPTSPREKQSHVVH